MLPPERIIFPIDDTPASLVFAESVLAMAVKCRANVVLLDTNQLAVLGRVSVTPMITFWENAMRQVGIEWKFDSGNEVALIRQAATAHDLIMMPYAPGGILQRWFGRIMVESVLNHCLSAVCTGLRVPLSNRDRPLKIACALDLHDDSGRIALNASFLARTLDASLTFVHVLPAMDEGIVLLAAGDDLPPTLNEQVARRELDALRPASLGSSELLVVRGDPALAIRNALKRLGADLLVLGPGRQQPGEIRLGAHVLDIVRAAPCPVLVLDKEQICVLGQSGHEEDRELAARPPVAGVGAAA